MDVLIILVFISLVLVVGGLIFLFQTLKSGDSEHADRLSLLPLARDDEAQETSFNSQSQSKPKENS
jgi:cbb3-type cytochrome oxidase maturation protein